MGDVIKALQTSTQLQEQKAASIDSIAQNNDDFIAEVVRIDESAASLIDQRKSVFYAVYAYLMPNYEMSWIESAANWFVSPVEWCRKAWADFWNWLSGLSYPEIRSLEPIDLSELYSTEEEQSETSGSVHNMWTLEDWERTSDNVIIVYDAKEGKWLYDGEIIVDGKVVLHSASE